MIRPHRLSKRPVEVPLCLEDSFFEGSVRDARFFGPVAKGLPATLILNIERIAAVSRLLFVSGPPTIIRSVVSAIVDPIQRVVIRWRLSHIFSESLKRIAPPGANRDADIPIVLIASRLGVEASVFHSCPSRVKASIRHAMSNSQLGSACSFLLVEAPATCRVARLQIACLHNRSVSTVAYAVPAIVKMSIRPTIATGKGHGDQPSKSAAGYTFLLFERGDFVRMLISHVRYLISVLIKRAFGVSAPGALCICGSNYTTDLKSVAFNLG